jgi:hypothetical protein
MKFTVISDGPEEQFDGEAQFDIKDGVLHVSDLDHHQRIHYAPSAWLRVVQEVPADHEF